MKILAIEASGPVAGCALYEDGTLIAEYSAQYKKKHSQSLVPMLQEMKNMVDLDLPSVDFIAVTSGPGSFTGLRIGAATAKGLGLAREKPILPVPTVDSLACNIFGSDRLICPLMDARRQQVYTGIYQNTERLEVLVPQCVTALSEITQKLSELAKERGEGTGSKAAAEVVFLGDGVPVNEKALREQMTVPYLIAPAHMNRQRAASTAVRAAQIFAEKGTEALVSADDFRPEYLRVPQAERERGDKRNYKVFV